MSDLDVVAVIEAKPGNEAEVKAALEELVTATRTEEGCVSYELRVAADAPTTFITIEKWRSRDDLDQHMKSEHIAKAFSVAGPLMAGQPAIYPLADA
ncbi:MULTISPECIES: putative quinol monooxygenase [Allobranchiibius]|uniref:Quinol monooxygenase YgiN n=1 Tax=Allobranchiibius huperziae TaxID=1874116 RepID=A0A853DEH1_9MICO|nr:putative quinol monooxygenase [Allobranchiibius sp. GilTou73]MBO1767093.1 antibiotic biosynthesis monooxygenase [Allobranchiibius sp. GilTou38]NYJ75966.1 quinol monooxygenase YgiN [Allobranchiibius huperziae]UIJ35914.1 antibiotic biosynthesis monooxygenase [Allobranchiibius sp. GilTou73]